MAVMSSSGRLRKKLRVAAVQIATFWKGLQILKAQARNPHNYKTTAQKQIRAVQTAAVTYWTGTLTAAEQAAWNAYAAGLPKRDRDTAGTLVKNEGGPATGMNEFIGAQVKYAQMTGNWSAPLTDLTPPAGVVNPPAPIITAMTYLTGTVTVNYNYNGPTPMSAKLCLFAKIVAKQKAPIQIVATAALSGSGTATFSGMRAGGSTSNPIIPLANYVGAMLYVQCAAYLQTSLTQGPVRSSGSNVMAIKLS
jgi:hypothetical protein